MVAETSVLVLGDNVNTDDIIPAARCTSAEPGHLKHFALEHIVGTDGLTAYDRIEAGRNFGCGSSREHAPIALKAAGIRSIRARSFAEIFYRNGTNIGLSLEIIDQPGGEAGALQTIADAGGLIALSQKRNAGAYSLPKGTTDSRPMTMTEKLLARASGNAYVAPGEVVFARIDLALSHDAVAGPIARLFKEHFGPDEKVWDPKRVVLVADHFIQVNDIRMDSGSTLLLEQMRRFADEQGCILLDEVSPGEAPGICHVLLPEQGFVSPGMIIAGTDSHTSTYGAFACFATGVGTTDMVSILATGDMWIRVPETVLVELNGTLPEFISAKDIMLFLLGKIGCDGATRKVVEFRGSVVDALPIAERMTLANMAVECGAMCGLIRPDEKTLRYLERCGARAPVTSGVSSDPECQFSDIYAYDLSGLRPHVARPPSPDLVVPVEELEKVPITKAYIGSCTGGKLFDLAQAAAVLEGRHLAPGTRLFIVPASQAVQQEADRLGYTRIFEEAGAEFLKSGCGACINAGKGALGPQETGVYATSRNFKGRSGDPTSKNYLTSPRVVAISAIKGWITDRLDD